MDSFEHALDSGQVKGDEDEESVSLTAGEDGDDQISSVVTSQGTLSIDPSVQYQLRADTAQISGLMSLMLCVLTLVLCVVCTAGQVTYRVVQVTQTEDGQTAVIQSPFSNGDSPSPDTLATTSDGRYAYIAGGAGPGDSSQVEALTGGASFSQVASGNTDSQGQLYVMMSPQDVLQSGSQRNIAPRTGMAPRIEGGRSTRDDRRRATHNEVERRRRDKINNWIVQLSKLIPDCSQEQTKAGQIGSKGGILSKACEYITELRSTNLRLAEHLKETERLAVDGEIMRQQCEELKQENAMLRAQLQQHGIVPPDLTGAGS